MLVIRGEAGIGKTALLHYCARQASGCRIGQLAGVESRALAAAQAHLHAGAFDAARGLLADAAAVAVDDLQRARVERRVRLHGRWRRGLVTCSSTVWRGW